MLATIPNFWFLGCPDTAPFGPKIHGMDGPGWPDAPAMPPRKWPRVRP